MTTITRTAKATVAALAGLLAAGLAGEASAAGHDSRLRAFPAAKAAAAQKSGAQKSTQAAKWPGLVTSGKLAHVVAKPTPKLVVKPLPPRRPSITNNANGGSNNGNGGGNGSTITGNTASGGGGFNFGGGSNNGNGGSIGARPALVKPVAKPLAAKPLLIARPLPLPPRPVVHNSANGGSNNGNGGGNGSTITDNTASGGGGFNFGGGSNNGNGGSIGR